MIGKKGEEVDVDETGASQSASSGIARQDQSLPMRVAQVWSGKGWGGIYIPASTRKWWSSSWKATPTGRW